MEAAYLFLYFIGFLIWIAILQSLIYSGTKTKERILIEKAQLNLLAAMARKAGVSDEEVVKILDVKTYKKKGLW